MLEETIRDYLTFLFSGQPLEDVIRWPPDAFACAASLLERSGGYIAAVHRWPPALVTGNSTWSEEILELGHKWRVRASEQSAAPDEIIRDWTTILNALDNVPVSEIANDNNQTICQALVRILAAADQACEGVGIPGGAMQPDKFELETIHQFKDQSIGEKPSTLCRKISPNKLTVLPKLHTPQSGITIRSLSHHIALCTRPEVKTHWHWVDYPQLGEDRHGLNVLVLPWPLVTKVSDFSPTKPKSGNLSNMDPRFGFFKVQIRGGEDFDGTLFTKVVKSATKTSGSVDVIVFPEFSLTEEDTPLLFNLIARMRPPPILIGGICKPDAASGMSYNTSVTLFPLAEEILGKPQFFAFYQQKHHRWRLNGSQIRQYGLGGILDPESDWWEHIIVSRRQLGFVSIRPWLTLCTLICEDLARPEPIANLVRAVGPNLVIALLMDGPQLAKRWPGRYGTVLADDPGSSVLTVSSLGMVELSRPPGTSPSRVIALWKDALSGEPTEISLPPEHQAVLLSLTRTRREEFTADGRSDGGMTYYLTLSGIHPVSA